MQVVIAQTWAGKLDAISCTLTSWRSCRLVFGQATAFTSCRVQYTSNALPRSHLRTHLQRYSLRQHTRSITGSGIDFVRAAHTSLGWGSPQAGFMWAAAKSSKHYMSFAAEAAD